MKKLNRKEFERLDKESIILLIKVYNNYIQGFDYEESGTPFSIYEFYEYEYQDDTYQRILEIIKG